MLAFTIFKGGLNMKETLQDLMTRRSCRKYRPEQIKDEELDAEFKALYGYDD